MKEYDKLQQRNGLNKTLVLEVLMTEPRSPCSRGGGWWSVGGVLILAGAAGQGTYRIH